MFKTVNLEELRMIALAQETIKACNSHNNRLALKDTGCLDNNVCAIQDNVTAGVEGSELHINNPSLL